ncbi:MAG: glucosyltransferase domain-containing protein [Lachnospiraceae bacterium]|nr:glucosyltransferase domain-containing protein [Lachnospiraceae bacterium]
MDKLIKTFKSKNYGYPFFATVICGLLTHMYLFTNKFPNADAMTNFWFDQNMVTSGRWFLGIACSISSYYDLNWIIGILSILFLAVSTVLLCEFFDIRNKLAMVLTGCIIVTFPAVTATFAYLYTADGYMIGFALAILAALLTKKYKWGFIPGGVCLAFSMGIYQAYLPATILLGMFMIVIMAADSEPVKEILLFAGRYLSMGVIGGILYFVILKICLALQGKVLDTYQGINNMGKVSLSNLPKMIYNTYYDFAAFALKGRIFFRDGFSLVIVVLLGVVVLSALVYAAVKSKAYTKWYFYLIVVAIALLLPPATNIILLISSEAYYHLLMRMQWVLFLIAPVVAIDRYFMPCMKSCGGEENVKKDSSDMPRKASVRVKAYIAASWIAVIAAFALVWFFVVTDNIAYFNMNERYEKTYAYCVRLADRIEQTEGYYTGMPIAMIGVVNEENYPDTDITGDVTERISGTTGSILTYKAEQYAAFMKHYLNVSINYIEGDEIVEIYNSPEYKALDSFPAKNSIVIVDGTMYIKTE